MPFSSALRGVIGRLVKGAYKGANFDDIAPEFLEWVEDYYNNKPLKVLGFKTPNQVWTEGLLAA